MQARLYLNGTQPQRDPDRLSHYLVKKPGSKPTRDWEPELDTMGLEISMLPEGPVSFNDVEAYEAAKSVGIYIWDRSERCSKVGDTTWRCLRTTPAQPSPTRMGT